MIQGKIIRFADALKKTLEDSKSENNSLNTANPNPNPSTVTLPAVATCSTITTSTISTSSSFDASTSVNDPNKHIQTITVHSPSLDMEKFYDGCKLPFHSCMGHRG